MYGASIAFKNFNPLFGILGSKWIGFQHFDKLFNSMFFWRVLKNTIVINILHLIFGFPAPIVLALLLNEVRRSALKRSFQTITYLPHFISWVIVGAFVVEILSPNYGLLTRLSLLFTGSKINNQILAMPRYFRSILVVSAIWKGVGWSSIIYLAAISGIDPGLYEAAIMDGASRWKQTLHITIPSILPTISVMFVLRFGAMLASNFEQIFVLLTPNVYEVGDVLSTYIFREGLQRMKFSYTTAVGLFQSVVGFVLLISANYLSRKVGSGLW
jgi:putative aldouronate transport system permease protein